MKNYKINGKCFLYGLVHFAFTGLTMEPSVSNSKILGCTKHFTRADS